jgi:hypothetical protein
MRVAKPMHQRKHAHTWLCEIHQSTITVCQSLLNCRYKVNKLYAAWNFRILYIIQQFLKLWIIREILYCIGTPKGITHYVNGSARAWICMRVKLTGACPTTRMRVGLFGFCSKCSLIGYARFHYYFRLKEIHGLFHSHSLSSPSPLFEHAYS